MTTIDVNTGGFVGTRSFDDTIFKTNLEAPRRSRASCGCATWGIIVLDSSTWSIRPPGAGAAELKKALARDRTRMTVSQFTPLAWSR